MHTKIEKTPALEPRRKFTQPPTVSQGWRPPRRRLVDADALFALLCGALLAACFLFPFLPSAQP